MFGGHGVFDDGVMFVIIDPQGSVYLRADETNAHRFEESGSEKHGRMPYWRRPDTVANHPEALLEWADHSRTVAHAAKK